MHVPDQLLADGDQRDRRGQGHSLFTVATTKEFTFGRQQTIVVRNERISEKRV